MENQSGKRESRLIPESIRDVSADDLLEFFNDVAPDACCPACGSDLMVMAAGKYDDQGKRVGHEARPAIVGVVIDEDPDRQVGLKAPAFPINCPTCGYITYFLANRVIGWKRENADEDSKK